MPDPAETVAPWVERHRELADIAARQLFFIGGAPRSGTTWVQELLDLHPDVSCRGEALFHQDLGPNRRSAALRPLFDPKRPTALFIGRYQPFHAGHLALIEEGLRRVGQVCIAVRDTAGVDAKNPFAYEYVRARIEHGLRRHEGRFAVVPLPNITHVFYGRDVGYAVERIDLDAELQAVSGRGSGRCCMRAATRRHPRFPSRANHRSL